MKYMQPKIAAIIQYHKYPILYTIVLNVCSIVLYTKLCLITIDQVSLRIEELLKALETSFDFNNCT